MIPTGVLDDSAAAVGLAGMKAFYRINMEVSTISWVNSHGNTTRQVGIWLNRR